MSWIPRSRLKIVGLFHSVKSLVRKDRLFCRVSSFCNLVCVFAEPGPTEDESILWKCQKTRQMLYVGSERYGVRSSECQHNDKFPNLYRSPNIVVT